jgi:hypothetical protein
MNCAENASAYTVQDLFFVSVFGGGGGRGEGGTFTYLCGYVLGAGNI